MRTFRLLTAPEVECRVSEIRKTKTEQYVKLLLYKTVRTDAAILDETFGPMNWQNKYEVIDGKMYCSVGVKDPTTGEWIWKQNVGTESNMEAEKGEASDAMKRAGFVWGIGTELYTAPEIKVSADMCNIKQYGERFKCYDRFTVEKIAYDESESISGISILCNGKRCFVWQKNADR